MQVAWSFRAERAWLGFAESFNRTLLKRTIPFFFFKCISFEPQVVSEPGFGWNISHDWMELAATEINSEINMTSCLPK